MKKPQAGKRVSLGLKVTAETKDALDKEAKRTGKTQSQVAEYRINTSIADDAAFSSSQIRFWAIYHAALFQKAGADRAFETGHGDWEDKEWMADPDCLRTATFEVIEALIRELVRQPGADLTAIAAHTHELEATVINAAVSAGRARWVEKEQEDAR